MLFLVFVALPAAFLVAPAFVKRFALGAFFISAGVFAMAGSTPGGDGQTNPEGFMSLRLGTVNETAEAGLRKRAVVAPIGLTAAGYRAKSLSVLANKPELAELREQIKYELRRGNITTERAASLSALIDEINLENNVTKADAPVSQVGEEHNALADTAQFQAQLNETLADTIKLVKVLDSVHSPEFAGTLIAAKIQVVRLLAEKAAVDGSIDEIRKRVKRPTAG